jgi:hypothetical protein
VAKPRPTLEWFYDADTETIRIQLQRHEE